MPTFTTGDGKSLWFANNEGDGDQDDGDDGVAVVLLHGFASTAAQSWVRPGVVTALLDEERRVITFDSRGHGQSDRPREPSAYEGDRLAEDVLELADHIGLDRFDLGGYSMGAHTALRVAEIAPDRVRRLALGGIGATLLEPYDATAVAERQALADMLEADELPPGAPPTVVAFRHHADATAADRMALAAFQRAQRTPVGPDLAAVTANALVVCGDSDTLAGPPGPLAAALRTATAMSVPGDHFEVVARSQLGRAFVAFLTAGDGA